MYTDRDKTKAQLLAQALHCRFVAFEALYSTLHDVLIYSGEAAPAQGLPAPKPLHGGCLKPGMTVVDLTAPLRRTKLLRDAAARDCLVVDPAQILLEQVAQQAKLLTGKEVPRQVLQAKLKAVLPEEEEG